MSTIVEEEIGDDTDDGDDDVDNVDHDGHWLVIVNEQQNMNVCLGTW